MYRYKSIYVHLDIFVFFFPFPIRISIKQHCWWGMIEWVDVSGAVTIFPLHRLVL